MNSSNLKFKIIQFNSIESTNIYARKFIANKNEVEGLVFKANFQEKGKGQNGQTWESEEGKNLLFSLVVNSGLKVDNQFQLSKSIGLGLKKYLDSMSVGEVTIKWPNDILVNGHKIAGILIENNVVGNLITSSIIGIGFNINQLKFSAFERPATSLKLLANSEFQLEEELDLILNSIKYSYSMLIDNQMLIDDLYLKSLYGYGKVLKFSDEVGQFKGVILGVTNEGKLLINKKGKLKNYSIKQIDFID